MRRIGTKLLARLPTLQPDERIIWEHGCNWNKNGIVSKAGFLFITNRGRLIWRSARHDFPRNEWIRLAVDIQSVEVEKGNISRKASAPFAAGLRTVCEIKFTNGDVESIFPSSISFVLAEVADIAKADPRDTLGSDAGRTE